MGVFFFGMGYSSLAAAHSIHEIVDPDVPIAGTTRTEEGVERLAESPYRLHVFDGTRPGTTLGPDLRKATHVVLSIPPTTAAIQPAISTAATSTARRASSGSATIRPSASMATSAANGSTKVRRPDRSTSAARSGWRPSISGAISQRSAACRCWC